MVTVTSVRHAYPEGAGFRIERPFGHGDYTFLHFMNEMNFSIGGETVRTRPDACILYDKTTPQYFSGGPVLHDWMHFTCTDEKTDLAGIELNRIFYPVNGGFITYITQEIEREFFGNFPDKERMIAAKFDELIVKLKRSLNAETTPVAPETAAALETLRQELFTDLSKNRSIGEMAQRVGFSASRFFELYKKTFGISPVNDLIVTKINAAKNLLTFTDTPISEIAGTLGYANATHFTRQFKERVGASPLSYRQMTKNT